MVNLGRRADVDVLRDHWTVVTRDRLPSAHVEHTLAVTADGVKILTYVLLGVCVGIATLLYVPRLGSASPTTGLLWELEAIAAVIVGGTALKGGSGSVVGTVIGAILLSVISNILNLTSIISVYLNAAVQGFVIIVVAFLQRGRR